MQDSPRHVKTSNLVVVACIASALASPVAFTAPVNEGDFPITLLQTTDLHHHANGVDHVGLDVEPLSGRSLTGSYARIAAYADYVRATAGHPVILVDSGDWTMGTLYDLTLGKEPLALGFIKRMGYDCVTLGNHEFDYTPKGLAQMLGAAQSLFGFDTPMVASNMNLNGNTDLAPYFGTGKAIQTSRVKTLPNGLQVGYIGFMGRAAALDAPGSAPVSFTSPSAQYAAIQALVNELRNAQGVQIVIALNHAGTDPSGTSGEDVDLARHVTGIDVIASGHTHTPLASARTVVNGTWHTQIIDAGAYGTNVARLDFTYHSSSKTTTLNASSNVAMTDASLAGIHAGLVADPVSAFIVRRADEQLNAQLEPLLGQIFPDYDPAELGTGIYHPVGVASQNMVYNGADPVPAPNGLGDLAADAVRSVPNALIAQTLTAVGGNPANMADYDFTPFQVGAVATGVLRSKLLASVPLSFADVYNVLPLGISPDSSQALPIGYPLISAYLNLADLKKVCALQLVAQSNLAPPDFYLNLSGIQYSLKTTESYLFFKYATAASVLQVTSQKAVAGSAAALQALGALSRLGSDGGAALLGAYTAGNPYAAAMVSLNDSAPSAGQIPANLSALGQVAAAAAADSAAGTATLSALIVSKAVAAIDTVSGFAPSDSANVGATTVLSDTVRVRVAVDFYAVLLLGAVQAQFGVSITPYRSGTGTATLSSADIPGVLSNRIGAAAANEPIPELKEWMALLSYLSTGLGGSISSEYSSTASFAQFGSFGAAVKVRNATYPLARIGQLVTTVVGLRSAP
jgi:2',3'-cyclic-nucleotide 2'-phosphodiesterase (5'-nucleotidase family)